MPLDDAVAICRLNADGVVMCGIAGLVDLAGERAPPPQVVRRMTQAIAHRGPDQEGYFSRPGVELGARRLSIVGLADGRQPVFSDDGNVVAVFNGQLFDYPETRAALAARGRRLVTRCDTELIPHLYDDSGEDVFEGLRGQFAVAIWDGRRRRLLLKLRGFRDKHLLRVLSERWLPPSICRRPKAMFRAPVDSFYKTPAPSYVTQLMSTELLVKTGYFDPAEVRRWIGDYHRVQAGTWPRQSLEFGLTAVLATQLWHQIYISDDLADMPARAAGRATF